MSILQSSPVFANTGIRPVLSNLFGELPDHAFDEIISLLEWVDLPGGNCLFRQGDKGETMYIILHGRLRIVLETPNERQILSEIGKGEWVGEMALISGAERSASVFAIRDCQLGSISRKAFLEICGKYPSVSLNLSRLIIERFTKKEAGRRKRRISSVALIGLQENIRLEEFANRLVASLPPGKTALLLDSRKVDEALGAGSALIPLYLKEKNQYLLGWLESAGVRHDLVIYIADQRVNEWTSRCIRQADEILMVADATAPPDLSRREEELLLEIRKFSNANQTLVLLHPSGVSMPAGTAVYMRNRPADFHLHLRKDHETKDFGRLARYLADATVGLVLAGGGARGQAHIGVLRALEEAKVPIDLIGGTSMGALVGAFAAHDWEWEQLHENTKRMAERQSMKDFNLVPMISLLKGTVLEMQLRHFFKHYDIEDLPLNFFCVSSNMTQAVPKIHRRGSLFKALRASVSLPGIFPPVVDGGHLYVDGGLFNNFPTDLMHETGTGLIIGVDLEPHQQQKTAYEQMPGNRQVLLQRIFGIGNKHAVPNMIGTIIQTTALYSTFKQKQSKVFADIYIHPNVQGYSLMQWSAFDELVEEGYRAASDALEKGGLEKLAELGVFAQPVGNNAE